MSEHAATTSHWRAPAHALARWTALLMGWVWLGQQGQRLGWTVASGLLAVALWWAVRLLVERLGTPRTLLTRQGTLALGGATAAGATAIAQAQPAPLSHTGLLALAVLWALWSHGLDRQSQHAARCPRPWAGWPPIVAAAATWLSLRDPNLIGGGILLGAAVLAWIAAPKSTTQSACLHPARCAPPIASTAMGWMMGSLWLSNAWCVGTGWSSETVVGLHLVLMTALPACIQMDWLPRRLPDSMNSLLPPLWVALGSALLWATPLPANGWLSMLLFALAWALPHSARTVQKPDPHRRPWLWAPLLAPLVLIFVGHSSALMGPQALVWAYTALGSIACAVVVLNLRSWWRSTLAPASLRRL